MKEMLEELFTYTKLQNGTYELKLEPQNVGQILKETVFSYYDDWAEQGIQPSNLRLPKNLYGSGATNRR